MYTCPKCEGEINQASEICPRCGADLAGLSAAALAAEPSKARSTPRLLLIWGSVIAVIALGIYGFVWHVLPEYATTESARVAEVQAVQALTIVNSTLAQYLSAEGHYPQTLEQLGERAQRAAQAALRRGYALQYSPGAADSAGAVHTYSLMARPARYGLLKFYTDQTGAIHKTRENRPATANDPALQMQ